MRARLEPLRVGGIRWLHADDDLVVFLRETGTEAALVAADRRGDVDDRRVVDLLEADGLWRCADPAWRDFGATIWQCAPAT